MMAIPKSSDTVVPGSIIFCASGTLWALHERHAHERSAGTFEYDYDYMDDDLTDCGAMVIAHDEYQDMTLILTEHGMFWTYVHECEVQE